MLKDVIDLTSHEAKGLNTSPNLFMLNKDQSPNMMNVKVELDGSWSKRLGTVTMNTVVIANSAAANFSPNIAGTLTSSLQAFWKLDEASGTRFDAFNTNDLTDGNSTTYASGIKNKAALFVSANSNYLLSNNIPALATGDIDMSMSTWFYLTSTSPTLEQTIISKKDLVSGANIVLLLHCDGVDGSTTFTDSEITPKTVTPNGDAQIDTAQSKFGGASALFDGTGDYLTLADSADWDFGTGDFTIDFWVQFNSAVTGQTFIDRNNGVQFSVQFQGGNLQTVINAVAVYSNAWAPLANTWYHIAVTRNGSNLRMFVDGTQIGTTQSNSSDIQGTDGIVIGGIKAASALFNGWIDELRIIKGRADYTANFSLPTSAYTNPSNPSQYEYQLFVNTDQLVTFRVSSSGTAANGTVQASSFGAVTTGTWYNVIAWHDTGDRIGVSVNLSINSASYASGLRSGSAPFVIGAISNGAGGFMNGRIDETGFWKKVLSSQERIDLYNAGLGNTYQRAFDTQAWASFDFGASSIRWLTVAAGTGIYASSNLGVTFVNIATDRTANYQYFERSKNVLVTGSESYDTPLFWAGSTGTFSAVLNISAPLVKYWINHQGFLIGLNSSTRKRGFFYEDENTQLTGGFNGTLTAGGNFDIPSSADDELTGGFVLRRRLYCSTRYFLYGVDYQGGNPDWNFRKIKDFGFVSRTVKIMQIEGVGEVAIGLDWGNKLRIFDGADDKIVSGDIEFDNGICDFSLDKISNSGSGRIVSFAEMEKNEGVYKLCVSIGGNSSQTTHFINYNREQAFYPDNNRPFNTMCSAESNNTQYTMAFDRSGRCHMLDSGNKDAGITPIQDVLDLNYFYDKSPSESHKNYGLDLFFINNTAGRVYIKESINFDNQFTDRDSFIISGTGRKHIFHKNIDIPNETNSYQPRITTSGGTSDPWVLIRSDFFTKGMGIGKTE